MKRVFCLFICILQGALLAAGEPSEIIAFLGPKGIDKPDGRRFRCEKLCFHKISFSRPCKTCGAGALSFHR